MIVDPWDPLVMWNDDDDDDDGDDHIKNPSANLPCADNLSRHHLDHNSYSKNPQIRSYFDDPLSCCTMQLVSKQSSELDIWIECLNLCFLGGRISHPTGIITYILHTHIFPHTYMFIYIYINPSFHSPPSCLDRKGLSSFTSRREAFYNMYIKILKYRKIV